MSKKMKGVVLDSSSYGSYEDAKARFKHQALLQDYQELHKEAEATRNKLETMKQRKLTLLAEVRFLRRRHKYLLQNKAEKPEPGRQLVQQKNSETQLKTSTKEKSFVRKEAKLRNVAPIADTKKKERILSSACRNPSPILDLIQMNRVHSRKEAASLRNTVLVFDLNQMERTYGGKQATFRNQTPILDLNQKERLYSGKETTPRIPVPVFDLNRVESTYIGRDDRNRAPIFDLNQISGEEMELQNNYEPLRMEEPKSFLIRGGSDEQLNEVKLSICRNVGNGPNRAGKRKISWQDQVALKV
ncbi:Serine/threonine-protein kinase irlE [Actinidia chinensis var. chinensis]|uniref:Serine/threonine-protein kinase irlE n=1 Tax=Actinidia chinensis var. chinensis TaxID=1590841 RepID=A0A2R6QIB1_ACTCC|nr:Serine/threonine-protein kinase irlE [Actinidia chinensis var. chinensis]